MYPYRYNLLSYFLLSLLLIFSLPFLAREKLYSASRYASQELEAQFFKELDDTRGLENFSRSGKLENTKSLPAFSKSYGQAAKISAYGSSPDGSVFLFIKSWQGKQQRKEFILYSTKQQSARIFTAENKAYYQQLKSKLLAENELGLPLLRESIPSQSYHMQNLALVLLSEAVVLPFVSPTRSAQQNNHYNGNLYSLNLYAEVNGKRYAALSLRSDVLLFQPPKVKEVYYSAFSTALGVVIEHVREQTFLERSTHTKQSPKLVKEELLVFCDLQAILDSRLHSASTLLLPEKEYKLSRQQKQLVFYTKTFFSIYSATPSTLQQQQVYFHDGSQKTTFAAAPPANRWFSF